MKNIRNNIIYFMNTKKLTINDCIEFNENISAYVDNELEMEENLKIRKILIKSEYSEKKMQELIKVINLLKTDFKMYERKINAKERVRNIYLRKIKMRIRS